MPSSIKYEVASIANLATTELNSLAAGSAALGAEYDNATNLYLYGFFELNVDFASAPAAGGVIDLYLIPAPDGTNYDDNTTGASEYAPLTTFIGSFPIQATANAQKIPLGGPGFPNLVPLPPCKLKAFLVNNTNQAFPASGSTLKMIPYRLQVA
jgi:hypothetical protein